ncbi:MAG: hypothetical protein R3285_10290, partial [Kiloniellales bacterium]|nr:hypothetical protein [Kiloniellales bacterium]
GRREAAFRDAEAREREAEAEAKATTMVSDSIAGGNVTAVNYFVAQRYVDALGRFANSPNQKILFLPLEASSVIGAIGGVAEIAKEAFGGPRPPVNGGGAPAGSGNGGNGGGRRPAPSQGQGPWGGSDARTS